MWVMGYGLWEFVGGCCRWQTARNSRSILDKRDWDRDEFRVKGQRRSAVRYNRAAPATQL